MTAIAGLRGTGDWGTDERPKNFRELILFRNPNGSSPIFSLMAKVRKESTDDSEFSWWDEPNDIVRVQINGALTAAETLFTIDSADPTSLATASNVWGTAKHLKPGDLLLSEPLADAATYNHEIIEVVSALGDTQFIGKRGASGTSAAVIADNAFLTKLGSMYPEGTSAPKATTRNPIKYTNFTQIFKDTYDITGSAAETKLRTGDPIKNDKKRKAFDHARDIEMALLWGQKSETTGDNGKPVRTFDGVRKFIPTANTTILAANWGIASGAGGNLLDAMSPVFDFETEAGDSRMIFAGNGALNAFNKKIHTDTGLVSNNIRFAGDAKMFGMSFQEFVVPQGRFFIKTHPLLSRHSLYTNSMFIIDFSALRWRPHKNRDTKFKDNVQAKDEDSVRGFWQTDAGLEVRFGGLTLGYIGGFGN